MLLEGTLKGSGEKTVFSIFHPVCSVYGGINSYDSESAPLLGRGYFISSELLWKLSQLILLGGEISYYNRYKGRGPIILPPEWRIVNTSLNSWDFYLTSLFYFPMSLPKRISIGLKVSVGRNYINGKDVLEDFINDPGNYWENNFQKKRFG